MTEHPHEHAVPRTTHTVELDQVAALNEHLAAPGAHAVTAGEIGLAGADAAAVVVRLELQGPPEFPYVFAHLAGRDRGVPVHTEALRALSHRFGLRQHWGF